MRRLKFESQKLAYLLHKVRRRVYNVQALSSNGIHISRCIEISTLFLSLQLLITLNF